MPESREGASLSFRGESSATHPSVATARDDERDRALHQALLLRRVLAWTLSLLTLALTVGFFALMTLAAPLLSRVALGHYITLANVLAVALIVLFLASIAVFGRYAAQADALLHNSASAQTSASAQISARSHDFVSPQSSASPQGSAPPGRAR
jgi:uncharacterized membrane protein (DUF485 family)